MKQVWQIDPEFRLLSVPLSLEEENRLENSLLREGCREPIVVWHGCILDGHKRYEICSYEEMDYKTVEMNFVSREDAIIWIHGECVVLSVWFVYQLNYNTGRPIRLSFYHLL